MTVHLSLSGNGLKIGDNFIVAEERKALRELLNSELSEEELKKMKMEKHKREIKELSDKKEKLQAC